MTPIMFEYKLIERAKLHRQHIVLPEGHEERILRASEILLNRQVVDLTLLGNRETIEQKISFLGLKLQGAAIIDPLESTLLESYARTFYELRKHKGISEQIAGEMMTDVNYFGTMMVQKGAADGMVSGAVHTTEIPFGRRFKSSAPAPDVSIVSSVFLMCLADRVSVYGDCAVNPDPTAAHLADIAISSADTAAIYGIEPRVAMCSYSTGESGKGKDVERSAKRPGIAQNNAVLISKSKVPSSMMPP